MWSYRLRIWTFWQTNCRGSVGRRLRCKMAVHRPPRPRQEMPLLVGQVSFSSSICCWRNWNSFLLQLAKTVQHRLWWPRHRTAPFWPVNRCRDPWTVAVMAARNKIRPEMRGLWGVLGATNPCPRLPPITIRARRVTHLAMMALWLSKRYLIGCF